MSSLAEINKELQKQSADIADMKANIAAQLKAEIDAAKKTERESGKREEARREAQRKSPKGFTKGFMQGTGIAGATGLVDGFLKGFFGVGSGILGAVLGTVGLVAGKLVKGTLLVGLLSTFGETAIKALFDKLKGTAFDLKLTKEQEDSFASKTTDGLMAFILTGLVFRNPLIRLGSALIFAFKDEILSGLEKYLGIKITNLGGKDGYVVSFKNRFFEGDAKLPGFGENFGTAIGALFSGFMLWAVGKFTSGVAWILRGGKSSAQAKFEKILNTQQAEFDRKLGKIEEQFDSMKAQMDAYNKYGNSRTLSEQARISRQQQAALTQIDTIGTTKLVTPPANIDTAPTKRVPIPGYTGAKAYGTIAKGLNYLDPLGFIENVSGSVAGKTSGGLSKGAGTLSRFLGGPVGLAMSFLGGGLFENEAGDGTISGILDGQALDLLQAMAAGASDADIAERQRNLKGSLATYGSNLASDVAMTLANAPANELKSLRNIIYARSTGQIYGAKTVLGKGVSPTPGSAKVGVTLTGEELNALDMLAATGGKGITYVDQRDQSTQQTNVSKTDKIAPAMTPAAVDVLHNRFLSMYSGFRIGGRQY
jgi:hypothetical protein